MIEKNVLPKVCTQSKTKKRIEQGFADKAVDLRLKEINMFLSLIPKSYPPKNRDKIYLLHQDSQL